MIGHYAEASNAFNTASRNTRIYIRARRLVLYLQMLYNKMQTSLHVRALIIMSFVFISSYYTLMMWFPDLFERFSQFTAYYGNVPAGVCEVSANLTQRATMSLLNESFMSTAPASLSVVMQTIKHHLYTHFYIQHVLCYMEYEPGIRYVLLKNLQ